MALIATGQNFEQPKAGTVQGVCVACWDLGFQNEQYQGQEPKVTRKIVLAFEIAQKYKDGDLKGKPMMISREYALSLGQKATLRKHLETWRASAFKPAELKGFDVEKVVGGNCFLTLVHTEGGKAKIEGIGSLPEGMPKMKPSGNIQMPKWVKDKQAKQVNPDGTPYGEVPDMSGGDGDFYDEGGGFGNESVDPNEPGF